MYLHFQTNRCVVYLKNRFPHHEQLPESRGAVPVIATPSSATAHDSVVAPAAAHDSVVAPAAARDSVADTTSSPNVSDGLAPDTRPPP